MREISLTRGYGVGQSVRGRTETFMTSSEPHDEVLSLDDAFMTPPFPVQLDDEIFDPEITYGELQKKLWAAHVRTTIQSLFAVFKYYVPAMSREDVSKFMAREQKD